MTKKKMTRIATAIAGTLFLALAGTACAGLEANKAGNDVQISMPLHVEPDVQVGNSPVYGSATVHSFLFGLIRIGDGKQAIGIDYFEKPEIITLSKPWLLYGQIAARNAAAYDAMKKANADIILAPRYEVEYLDLLIYSRFDCEIKGYPGRINGVRVK